jgi:hypothetical protein
LHGIVRGVDDRPAITSARNSADSGAETCGKAVIESPVIVEIESGAPDGRALRVHSGSRASLIPVNCQRFSG